MRSPRWEVGPGAVAAGRDITGNVYTGPLTFQTIFGRFDRLGDAIFDSSELIERLDLVRFEGRLDLISQIDERIANHEKGYILVRGEAGVGKSALAAHLAWTRRCVSHFTSLGGGARSPEEARKSIAAQLIGGWKLSEEFTPADSFPIGSSRPDWLVKVMRAAAHRRNELFPNNPPPLVVVVDGLDEAEADAPGMGTGVPLGLPRPDSLPSGVFVIATSRFGLPLFALKESRRVAWSEIQVDSVNNIRDMRQFLHNIVDGDNADGYLATSLQRHDVSVNEFVEKLLERCGGIWVYLRYVLDEIRFDGRSPLDVFGLPDRLRGYYLQQIETWSKDVEAWQQLRRPSLAVLAAMQRPVSLSELVRILNAADHNSVDLDEVSRWLNGPLRAFLVSRKVGGSSLYSIRHQSLRDLFIRRIHPDEPGTYVEDEDAAEQLYRSWTTANSNIINYLSSSTGPGQPDWSTIDEYSRLMFADHAVAAGQIDSFMGDPGFLASVAAESILRHKDDMQSPAARLSAGVLEAAATTQWPNMPTRERLWWLLVWARKISADSLARAIIEKVPDWPWTIRFAVWKGVIHRTLTGATRGLYTITTATTQGRILIASAGRDKTIFLWDSITGHPAGQGLAGHTGRIYALVAGTLDGDRKILASASGDSTIRIWDIASGEEICAPLRAHVKGVRSLALVHRSDGIPLLASAGVDSLVRLWDLTSGELVGAPLAGHSATVYTMTVIRQKDQQPLLASAGSGSTVYLWDPEAGSLVDTISFAHGRAVHCLESIPLADGRELLAIASEDKSVRLWDPTSGRPIGTPWIPHPRRVRAMAALPALGADALLATAAGDTVSVWNPITGKAVGEPLAGHTSTISSIAAVSMADGNSLLATASGDATVRLWTVTADRVNRFASTGHQRGVRTVALVPMLDGRVALASASIDALLLWDAATSEPLGSLAGRRARGTISLTDVRSPSGHTLLAAAGDSASIRLWDLNSGKLAYEIAGFHSAAINSLASAEISDGRSALVSASSDWTLQVWDMANRRPLYEPLKGHQGPVLAVTAARLSTGSVVIASGGADGTVRLWEAATGRPIRKPMTGHQDKVTALAAIPAHDGRTLLASASRDGTVLLWDPLTGMRASEPLGGHTRVVYAIAAVPLAHGGSLLATAGGDGTIRLWDPIKGLPVGDPLIGHVGRVLAVAAAQLPTGEVLLVSAGDDRAILAWSPSLRALNYGTVDRTTNVR
ncbi:hypothetical protein [Micromonospora parva]|uniref:hypothetical protein n=1 Tax=Micromonospora parva TaxID=1464048 RepID=UPI0033EEBF5B